MVHIYITMKSNICRIVHRHEPVKFWIKNIFLAVREQFVLFKMLPSVYLYVLLFFMIRITLSRSSCSCDRIDSDFASGVNLLYYKCNNETPATIAYSITEPENLLETLDNSKRTIFYIFGYKQFPEDENVQLMMNALCDGRTDNVVLLDWSKYSDGLYTTVFKNAEEVGNLFANSIKQLVDNGLESSTIYIVAYSLGTHIAGFAGKCNDFIIPRITGLDPANPMFYPTGCYLTSNDAAWVDVIHTDMGRQGTRTKGTSDYYVNGGIRPQPGCENIDEDESNCSQQKSVVVYALSKKNPSTYTAEECSSYSAYLIHDCNNIELTGFGYTATNEFRSVYLNITD